MFYCSSFGASMAVSRGSESVGVLTRRAASAGGVLLGCPLRPRALCVSSLSGMRHGGGSAPVESSAGICFAACAEKHYFVIGTKAAFLAYPC